MNSAGSNNTKKHENIQQQSQQKQTFIKKRIDFSKLFDDKQSKYEIIVLLLLFLT